MSDDLDFEHRALLGRARDAAQQAHAPHSGVRVGAALVTRTGKVYTGCNVENSSLGLTMCAERVALFKALSEGEREFSDLLVAANDGNTDAPPCGACRQVLVEFAPDLRVTYRENGSFTTRGLAELLPDAFGDGPVAEGETGPGDGPRRAAVGGEPPEDSSKSDDARKP